MRTFYTVHMIKKPGGGEEFESREEAVADAQRRQAADKDHRYAIMRAVAATVPPIPKIEVQTLED